MKAVSYADELPGFVTAADGRMRYVYGRPFTPRGPRQYGCSCVDMADGTRYFAVKCPLHGLEGRIRNGDVELDER